MATTVSELDIEIWLRKAVEWRDTTTLQIQRDVCLHLPKLHEFLLQIYETLKHMSTNAVIGKFPVIGQLLGRLCWNPIVIGHADTFKLLMCCLACLYSSEPQNAIEMKANSWIKNLVCHLFTSSEQKRNGEMEVIAQLQCSTVEYYDKLLKNIISSLIIQITRSQSDENKKDILDEHVRTISVTCICVLTLPEVAPLLEALLLYHGSGPKEVLDNYFLEVLNDAVLRKKIVLSESAVLSLWLRHLPSLEIAVLDLFQRLIALQSKSLKEMEQIIKDSFLVRSALHHFLFMNFCLIHRNALLECDGNIKVTTIIRIFTRSFTEEYDKDNLQPKLPLRAYFPSESPALVLALLRKYEGLTSDACVQHLCTVVKILRNMDREKRTPDCVFKYWYLLIHFGEWVDIAAEQLLTSDLEVSDDLLWLLAFYYNPYNEDQSRDRTMAEAKSTCGSLLSLFRNSTVCLTSLKQIFQVESNSDQWHVCSLQLIRHLCVTFLLYSPEWHSIIKQCIALMTQTQEAASEVSDVLARTLCRLDIPGMESRKIITIAHWLLQDF
ncbi:PREDICTED: Fanconi anemia group C protein [Nanorana parkeri]|uniref:Fanconi anemia group C protein n=1 Tax=Nanorana parkeri TaxID=125878 RepID=UPI000853FD02|nr:PREDICTED: Fanconi anemia group C protein [Nanorana parkeri]